MNLHAPFIFIPSNPLHRLHGGNANDPIENAISEHRSACGVCFCRSPVRDDCGDCRSGLAEHSDDLAADSDQRAYGCRCAHLADHLLRAGCGCLTGLFVVEVKDQNGEPFKGAQVAFSVTAGGGTLSAATNTTDANGRAATRLTLGRDAGTNTVLATVASLHSVTFTATAITPHSLRKVSGDKQQRRP